MYTPDVTLQNVLFRCSLQAHITKVAKRDHYIFYFFLLLLGYPKSFFRFMRK